jgi:hypothetical protein
MKTLIKTTLFFAGVVLMLASCENQIIEREPSPVVLENCLGVYFPSTNIKTVEMEPTQATEMTITISRLDSTDAAVVPITVVINDSNVFVVPENVNFQADQKTTTFMVTFPTAEEGVTYNLLLLIEGDEFVNQYASTLPFLETNVTRIKWTNVDAPFVYVDGTIMALYGVSQYPMYVETQKAELGTSVRYRFKNAYRIPTSDDPDADGIYDGYPYNVPGDVDESKDYYVIIEIDNDNNVSMSPSNLGVDWGYGMFSIGSIYGNLSTNITSYPLGTLEDSIITFPANSLYFSMANYNNGGKYPSSATTTIYMNKALYLKANMKIKDYNDVAYQDIIGAVSEFESAAYSENWSQTIAKALDIDSLNEDSEYKDLFYLPDLYETGYGLAFYYNGNSVTIPSNQKTGKKMYEKDIYVSPSDNVDSKVEINAKGVTIYTLGLKFHYEDGTVLGEFSELFFYSEDPVAYAKEDFIGSFTLSGPCLFDESVADMDVIIKAGTTENTFIIEGIGFAESVIATFNSAASTMSIAPQALADFDYNGTMLDMTLYTYTEAGEVSDTATLDFTFNMQGQLVLTSTSEAIGYVINSTAAGGYVDGYYDLVFTFNPGAPSSVAAQLFSASIEAKQVEKVAPSKNDKCAHNNFKEQTKAMVKRSLKTNGDNYFSN